MSKPKQQARLLTVTAADAKDSTIHVKKVGRNDPCPCGSGRKAKDCCGTKTYYYITKKGKERS